jgi:asparagine N-glycosylation enzyme membrane subunit Stt3
LRTDDGLRPRIAAVAVAALTFSFAFLVRISNLETAFVGGVPQIPPFDELYHAKRIVYSSVHLFRVLDFDPDHGPRGAFCPWPPLYDMTAGAAARLLGGRTPTGVVARASWFPPLVASLVAAAIAGWLTRRRGWATGLLAGAGVALAAYFVDASRLTAIDHHFLEFPLVLGLVVATIALAEATTGRQARVAAGILAFALLIALLVQTAIVLAGAVVLATVLLFDGRKLVPRIAAGAGFLGAAAIVALYRAMQPVGYPDNEWYLGTTHAAALTAAAVACFTQWWLLRRRASFAGSVFAAGVAGIAVSLSIRNVPEALLGGSKFLGGDPWLASIVQFRGMFSDSEHVWLDLAYLGGGFFLTAAAVASPEWRRGRRVLLLPFALGFSLAALTSMRFLSISAPLCAITGAVALVDFARRYRSPLGRLAAGVLLFVPSIALVALRVANPPGAVTAQMVPLVRSADYLRARRDAPGRVLGPWTWGHLFDVVAGRRVIVDNFGAMLGRTDFENAVGIVFATREKHVADYCASLGVRFVILPDPLPFFAANAEMSGLPLSAFATADSAPARLMRSTFWWRAYFEGGKERPGSEAFRYFRLAAVQTEPQPSGMRSAVQIWQLVSIP